MSTQRFLLLLSTLAASYAQQGAWGQCGGIGWTGQITCVSGYTCSVSNPYYSQCIPGQASLTTLRTTTSTKSATSSIAQHSSTSSKISTSTTSKSSTSIPTSPAGSGIKYLISFGDSYSQTGFDPTQQLATAANPLGNPAFPGYTTSGGPNWLGFYITQFNSSPIYSYNFASGGATTDASLVTPYAPTVLSLVDQVNLYQTSASNIPNFVRWTGSNSLFAIWIGVNDVGNAWYSATWTTLLGQIMAQYFRQVQKLYDSGARNFVFLSVPPTQYTPLMIGQGAATMDGLAAAIVQYNQAIASNAAAFQSAHPASKVYVLDTTKSFLTAINNPTAYGAPDATCFDASGTKCLWYNDYHPGQAIQKLVAQALSSLVGNW